MNLSNFFDKVILASLLSCLAFQIFSILTYFFLFKRKLKRYFITILSLTLLFQLIVIYGSFIEPRWILGNHKEIVLQESEVPTYFKVVFAADLHLGPYKQEDFATEVVEKINKEEADIVILGGDYVYNQPDQIKYMKPFKDVKSKYGVYAVFGNHDYELSSPLENVDYEVPVEKSEYIKQKLEQWNIHVLSNENTKITFETDNSKSIILAGIDDLWSNQDDLSTALQGVHKEDTVILVSHNPDIILDKRSEFADLILSAHTHGGQIRLPIFGSLTDIPCETGDKYEYGYFSLESGNQIYITKGLGEMGPRARLFTIPEIVVLDITI
jgi:predicted MPP superfamily phosphohydrolase